MYDKIAYVLNKKGLQIRGALHIGANICQELQLYLEIGVLPHDIVWIDAFQGNISTAKRANIPNVYHATITNKDDDVIDFYVMENTLRSSIINKNDTQTIYRVSQGTLTIPTFLKRYNLSADTFNLWNIDIEGAEWLALLGATPCIPYIDGICINILQHLSEIDDFLRGHGFTSVFQQDGKAFYLRDSTDQQ